MNETLDISEPEEESVSQEELGEFLWIFCKKIAQALDDKLSQELARGRVELSPADRMAFRREIIVLNLWIISKALTEKDEALEFMHQRYLRGCTQFFETGAKDDDAWARAKKELTDRYAEYYFHGAEKSMSSREILSLAGGMLKRVVPGRALEFSALYEKVVIKHLKDVLLSLMELKKEYEVLSSQ